MNLGYYLETVERGLGIATTIPPEDFYYEYNWDEYFTSYVRVPHKKGSGSDRLKVNINIYTTTDTIEGEYELSWVNLGWQNWVEFPSDIKFDKIVLTNLEEIRIENEDLAKAFPVNLWRSIKHEYSLINTNKETYIIEDGIKVESEVLAYNGQPFPSDFYYEYDWDEYFTPLVYPFPLAPPDQAVYVLTFENENEMFTLWGDPLEIGREYSSQDFIDQDLMKQYQKAKGQEIITEINPTDINPDYLPTDPILKDRMLTSIADSELKCNEGEGVYERSEQRWQDDVPTIGKGVMTLDSFWWKVVSIEGNKVFFEYIGALGKPEIYEIEANCPVYDHQREWSVTFDVNNQMRSGEGDNEFAVIAAVEHILSEAMELANDAYSLPTVIRFTAIGGAGGGRDKVYKIFARKIAREWDYDIVSDSGDFLLTR